jgi:hypothetical protein
MRNKTVLLTLFFLSFGIANHVLAASKLYLTNKTSSHIKLQIKSPESTLDTTISPNAKNIPIMIYSLIEGLTATAIDGDLTGVTSEFNKNPFMDQRRTAIAVDIEAAPDNKSLIIKAYW